MVEKHVIQMVWTLGRGGAERMASDLARSLPARGYRVTVVAAGGGGEMAMDFRAAGIPLIIAPEASRISRLRTVDFLREQLRQLKPDLLHTHLGADVWGGWARFREHLKTPWLITSHSFEPGLPPLQRFLRRWAYRHADQVVAVSSGVASAMRRLYGVEEGRMKTIRLGIDLKRFQARVDRGLGQPANILVIGRLVPEKNQALLLRALQQVKRPWRLTLAGEGAEHSRLQALAQSLGLLPHVTFAGSVRDVSPLLQAADLVCIPSRHEGQSLALLEAAASRVPVLASDLPAFHEAFDKRALGYVAADDPATWAKAITQLFDGYDAALERADRAQDIVHRTFSLDRMVDEYAELYRWMVPGKR
jgi:glycosyltransferase involved in cell wall biosynthesis